MVVIIVVFFCKDFEIFVKSYCIYINSIVVKFGFSGSIKKVVWDVQFEFMFGVVGFLLSIEYQVIFVFVGSFFGIIWGGVGYGIRWLLKFDLSVWLDYLFD